MVSVGLTLFRQHQEPKGCPGEGLHSSFFIFHFSFFIPQKGGFIPLRTCFVPFWCKPLIIKQGFAIIVLFLVKQKGPDR